MSVNSVLIYPSVIEIMEGNTFTANTLVDASDDIYKKVEWSSEEPSIASVNKTTGEIKGEKPGRTLICNISL